MLLPVLRAPLTAIVLTAWLAACSDVSTADNAEEANSTASLSEHLSDGSVRDTFVFDVFETRASVDVLFIDDNSDSMRNKQQKLGARLDSFIASLGKIDWQIGITTTDTSMGPYGLRGTLLPFAGTHTNVLTKACADYPTAFNDTIVRQETLDCAEQCPSTDETPLLATIEAIQKRDAENAGFFRPDAALAVIILSDEDENSTGGPTSTRPVEVVSVFQNAFGAQKQLTAFGIIVAPGDSKCFASETVVGAHYGVTIADLVKFTGGVTGSICDDDYGPALASIGKRVREGVKTAVLSATPVAGSLQIDVTPPDATLAWTLDGRTLTFSHPPKPGTTVVVRYQPK